MIYQGVELHNVAELQDAPNGRGVRPQRVPESVRQQLNPLAQQRMLEPHNVEIRFQSNSTCFITLSSAGQTRVTIFHGLFDSSERYILGPQPQTIRIDPPDMLRQAKDHHFDGMAFSPQVCRVIFGGPQRDAVYIHHIEGPDIAPPAPQSVPALRYLAYGTSITQGLDAEGPHLTYAAQTARLLGADLVNLGVDGSAHCEP